MTLKNCHTMKIAEEKKQMKSNKMNCVSVKNGNKVCQFDDKC